MKRHARLVLVLGTLATLLATALLGSGCKSDPGSQEFIPGKGWRSM